MFTEFSLKAGQLWKSQGLGRKKKKKKNPENSEPLNGHIWIYSSNAVGSTVVDPTRFCGPEKMA